MASAAVEAAKSPESFVKWTEELLELEQKAEGEETTELLASCTQAELQARGIALLRLGVAEQTTALYGRACLTLERAGGVALPVHRISHGDIVGLFDQGSRPLSKAVPLASAVVQRVLPCAVCLVFDAEVPNEVLDGRLLHLAQISSEVTLKRYREALDTLRAGRVDGPAAGLVGLCFSEDARPRFREAKAEGVERPDAVDVAFRAEQSSKLNEPQQAAVVKALRAADVAVIHGPPGTGKTTTLVAFILEAVYRKQRLLVTAPSNVAVDNLLERAVHAGCRNVVRLGHPARVQAELHKYTLDNVVYASEQAELCRDIKKEIDEALKMLGGGRKEAAKVPKGEVAALRKELRTRERRAVAQVLRKTQVVFATCAGAATLHRELRKSGDATVGKLEDFDVVVIDEAAQALEVACWIPLLLGKKAVLAGDHQQLAACVKSDEAQRRGLDRTLFGRLVEKHGDDVAALLNIQYRMNEAIMGWSSASFYDSRLAAADCVASRTLELKEVPEANLTGETLEAMRSPFLFVDTGGLALYREEGQESREAVLAQQSRGNPGEARFVVHYGKLLIKAGLSPKDLTVITPYNRQVERLRGEFAEDVEAAKLGLEKPRVNTVDSFQGQEADAVLISLVRSNERGAVGFLADYRRLNVAVTRARKQVMVVGDAATISSDETLASLYDYACSNGKVLFVQQLLDENGCVPADPATIAPPPKVEKVVKKEEKKKLLEEEEVRARFEKRLARLKESGGFLEFPATLNPFERAMAHEVAKDLGLLHESRGEGMKRRLVVCCPGCEMPPEQPAKGKKAAEAAQPSEEPGKEASEDEAETALEAFERRAKKVLEGLGKEEEERSAEWRVPEDEVLAILERLAGERGLLTEVLGSGRKRRWRAFLPEEEGKAAEKARPAAAASSSSSSKAAASSKAANVSGTAASSSAAAAAAAPATNSMLAELHAQRQRRKEEEAAKRKEQNEAVKQELKTAKAQRKAQDKAAERNGAGEEDFDALLQEFVCKEGVCAFGNCREKVHTLMDSLSLCRYCNKRFCLNHAQAEVHGCGEAAQKAEQKKFRQGCESAMNPRGSGLVNKACGDHRGAVANKLQEKIKSSQDARTAKKKDTKKK